MVNVKFNLGNRIMKGTNIYITIRVYMNLIIGSALIGFSFAMNGNKINWLQFWIGISVFAEVMLLLLFRLFLLGFGMLVCDAAYRLSEKKAVTYLDYKEAQKELNVNKITDKEFEQIELEYVKNDSGYID